MKEPVLIGQITGAVGLKGEVKLYSYAASQDRFLELERLYLGKDQDQQTDFAVHEIKNVRFKGPAPILQLTDVSDRNAAEALRFRYVFMDSDDLPPLEPGEHYVRDLIGLSVTDEEGTPIGTLKEIRTDSPQNLYVIQTEDGREVLLPGVSDFVIEKNPEQGYIRVRLPKGLLDL